MNRLGLHDLIEPINKNLEFQLQDPFLLYRNGKGKQPTTMPDCQIYISSGWLGRKTGFTVPFSARGKNLK